MKYFLISDNLDTQIGLMLGGVETVIAREREEILEVFKKAINDKENGLVLVTEIVASKIPEEIKKQKLSENLPLVFVIPDRHGWRGDKNFITRYVEDAIGVKINERNK